MDERFKGLIEAVRQAGAAALALRARGLAAEEKADRTPVTEADRLAEAILLDALARLYPGIPVVAEESCAAGRVPAGLDGRFFLVDPIDGTREFVAGGEDFTVNVALVENHRAMFGIVDAPALGQLFCGTAEGASVISPDGASQPIRVRRPPVSLRALASRSHRTAATNDYLAQHAITDVAAVGSSLKFCRLAEGTADIYPCFGTTMEWDTAAGQAVLEAAGGRVVTADGESLAYGTRSFEGLPDLRNPHFIALGGAALPVG